MASYSMLAASELDQVRKKDGIILDVRTYPEHDSCRLDWPHELIPLDRLDPQDFMLRRGLDREADVFILCKGGTRAKAAAEKFLSAGYPNMHVIEGGIMSCESMGVPVIGTTGVAPAPVAAAPAAPARKVISLERQVRIAAGALAAAGALLALTTGVKIFAFIPLFIGGGLVFAGVTDRCGMAMMLMKAPWNKSASCGSAAACGGPVKPNAIPPSSGSAGGCA
jgi:rhodanese-related sulfurtransferase